MRTFDELKQQERALDKELDQVLQEREELKKLFWSKGLEAEYEAKIQTIYKKMDDNQDDFIELNATMSGEFFNLINNIPGGRY